MFIASSLEFLEIVYELYNSVHGILEILNSVGVLANIISIFDNETLHVLLACTQVVDDVPKIGVNLIVMLEVLIHVICLFAESCNFHFSRSDIALEFFNLIIQDEFKLFKLLGLLLEAINVFLFISNSLVLFCYALMIILDFRI